MLVLAIGDFFIPDRASDINPKFKKLLSPGKISQVLCLGNLTDTATLNFLKTISPDLQLVRGDCDVDLYSSALASSNSNGNISADHNTGNNGVGSRPLPATPSHTSIPATINTPITIPLTKVVTHDSLRIGFTHGHTIIPNGDPDALLIAARQLDVDVFVWGGTHTFEAYELEGKFFVNPGSATGAFSTSSWEPEARARKLKERRSTATSGSSNNSGKESDHEEDATSTDENKDSGNHATSNGDTSNDDKTKHEGYIVGDNVPSFCLIDVQGSVLVLYVYQYMNGEVKVEKITYRKGGSSQN